MKPEWSVSALLKAASISKPIFIKKSQNNIFQKFKCSELNSSDQSRPEEDKSDTRAKERK